jgi:CD36 family
VFVESRWNLNSQRLNKQKARQAASKTKRLTSLLQVEGRGGIPGYRFTPSPDVFASVEKNPENMCYCPGGPPCAPHGLFNVSLCQYGEHCQRLIPLKLSLKLSLGLSQIRQCSSASLTSTWPTTASAQPSRVYQRRRKTSISSSLMCSR